MSAETAALAGQDAAEATMTDTCIIRHPGGTTGAFDPDTGTSLVTPYPPFYDGRCAVRDDAGAMREVLVAEQEVGVGMCLVKVPMSVTEVGRGDLVDVTESLDPSLVERGEMTVQTVHAATYSTSRRLLCTWR